MMNGNSEQSTGKATSDKGKASSPAQDSQENIQTSSSADPGSPREPVSSPRPKRLVRGGFNWKSLSEHGGKMGQGIVSFAKCFGVRAWMLFLTVLCLILLLAYETLEPGMQIEIQPIGAPPPHTEDGYAPRVVSLHLIDEVDSIRNAAQAITMHHSDLIINEARFAREDAADENRRTTLLTGGNTSGIGPTTGLSTLTSDDYGPDFVVPAVGVSINATAAYLRDLFGMSRRVGGELITVGSEKEVELRLRIDNQRVSGTCQLGKQGAIRNVLHYGAREILCAIQPLTLAAYYYAERDVSRSARLISLARHSEGGADLEAQALALEGRLAALDGRLDDAIEKYSQAVEEDPTSVGAYNSWGNALRARRRYEEAIEKYKMALAINRTFAPTYRDWGNVLYLMEDYDGAIGKYTQALVYEPMSVRTYTAWGNALREKGDYGEANEKYREALILDETFAPAHIGLGSVRFSKDDFEGAAEQYRLALELNPEYSIGHFNLGEALYEMDEYAQASKSFARAAEYNPGFASVYRAWGEALCKMGEDAAAQEKFQTAQDLGEDEIPTCPEEAAR